MPKIKRTPTRAEGGITPDEKKAIDAIVEKWTKIAYRTESIDKRKITIAIERLYETSGFHKPRVVIAPSPFVMALSYGLSYGVWRLRKNSDATRDATRDARHTMRH